MKKRRILLVEDEEVVRTVLRRFLETDYEVHEAGDGRAAIELAKRVRPNLIFLDLRMPRLDGMDTLRILKMSADTVEIPVVILSGVGETGSLMDAETLGAVDYLIKPFKLNEVLDMVKRYMVLWKEDKPPEPPPAPPGPGDEMVG